MKRSLILALISFTTITANAVTIIVDYSYDLGYFPQGSAARSTIERAAADLGSVLADGQLAAVPTRSVSGYAAYNNGMFDLNTLIDMHLSHVIKNPATGDIARLAIETFRDDEIRIYVSMNQFLTGIVKAGHSETSLGVFGAGYQPSWQQAMDIATANANALFGRGSSVRTDQISGSLPQGTAAGNYSVGIAPMAGWISFNPGAGWQLDAEAAVSAGQRDLYSYALDQMLGILQAAPGNDPVKGERSHINTNDLSALQAAGWKVIPEPGVCLLGAVGAIVAAGRRKRQIHS
jgi:hypothetical protein